MNISLLLPVDTIFINGTNTSYIYTPRVTVEYNYRIYTMYTLTAYAIVLK